MPTDSSQLASRVNEKIAALYRERDGFLAKAAEVDTKIVQAMQLLGLDPQEFGEPAGPQMQRLPAARHYPLDPNTMGAVMVETLLNADHGYTRVEMRKLLEETPKFAGQIKNNINSYYNTVNRYLSKGRIVDRNGYLYHPDRAPLPEGQSDPTGQHLSSNVSTLFPERKAGNSDD